MLRSGEFFGRSRTSRHLGAFDVSVTDDASGSAIGWHEHSGPYLTYVVRDAFRVSPQPLG